MVNSATILVLDDDPAVRRLLEVLLRSRGYGVVGAADVPSALAQCAMQLPDLMVVDLMLPIEDGEKFLREFRRRWLNAQVPVILLSASTLRARIAENLDVAGTLGKPFLADDLIEMVEANLPAAKPAAIA